MFEKSLYELIRGLRNHKGNEKEYIQSCLKECRNEIRGQDMDVKATALLKLVYLEMFGHDMSWAAFHVLEVMSSQKYLQKRVGYLGAVQSFRPDTEVLMLATNLLKKDLTSTSQITMSLPIITLPHIITSSLALSVLSDLLPRLTHSNPTIRKKTIVTLYRLALVYPETLRPSWPKIKERLMDEHEDPSVTAAIVNVVCELGWRRPQDFLPLAPRLFELLVDSGNNWMAIKLIKLFATLTPLEPRLVRKLLPPLTSIIRTTPAMSLLYECINGIIQGGILNAEDDSAGGMEIARLCVSKLRSMIMVDGDPNLKYVALLAFGKIVVTHPYLVAQQEDVIMNCLDSADISIRMRALDLVVGMVSSDNLVSIVSRLMRQLRSSPAASVGPRNDHRGTVDPVADSDDESLEVNIKNSSEAQDSAPPLPDEYKVDIIRRILEMCSTNNYSNLVDFDWYIDVLTQLVRNAPVPRSVDTASETSTELRSPDADDISTAICDELRNLAVKVKAIRPSATRAAESIITASYNGSLSQTSAGRGALKSSAFIAGEYASHLSSPDDTLTALLQLIKMTAPKDGLPVYLQAVPKIFAMVAGGDTYVWTAERKTMIALLMTRILHTFEPMQMHPDLEVQERAVEFTEVLKLAQEAASGQESSVDGKAQDAPLLLTQALPSLFHGAELNSVAVGAQRNVPVPTELDLDQPINDRLNELLNSVGGLSIEEPADDEFDIYYHQRPAVTVSSMSNEPAINQLGEKDEEVIPSYQQSGEESYLDPDIVARRRAERAERNKDDPFYIGSSDTPPGSSAPLHNILQSNIGPDLDIDSIPIMQLDIGKSNPIGPKDGKRAPPRSVPRQSIQVAADETLLSSGTGTPRTEESDDAAVKTRLANANKSLLQVDSSNIGAFSLEGGDDADQSLDYEAQQREEEEMAKAMKEVERLRLEMQRASERIQAAQGVPPQGTVVKKKAKKKVPKIEGDEAVKPKKKKTKAKTTEAEAKPDGGLQGEASQDTPPKKKKKKKKVVVEEAGDNAEGTVHDGAAEAPIPSVIDA